MWKRVTFLVVLYIVYDLTNSKQKFQKMTGIDCIYDDSTFFNWSCVVKNVNNVSALYLDFYLKRPVDNVMINMQFNTKLSKQSYTPFPINVTVDACAYFKGKPQSFYMGFIMKWMKKKSNMNHACPYTGHVYARNLSLESPPVFVPRGDYRIDLKYYERSKLFGEQRIYIVIP